MDDFLPLEGIFGFLRLNEFYRIAFILDFREKTFFELMNIFGDIPYRKLVNFECKLLSWSARLLIRNCILDPPLPL